MSGPVLEGCATLPPMGTADRKEDRTPEGKPRRHDDRFGLLNAFTDEHMADLNRSEIAVWLILWRDAREGIARTGQTDIARRAGIHRTTAARTIERLKRRGLLSIVHRGGIGRGISTYRVHAPPGTAPVTQ